MKYVNNSNVKRVRKMSKNELANNVKGGELVTWLSIVGVAVTGAFIAVKGATWALENYEVGQGTGTGGGNVWTVSKGTGNVQEPDGGLPNGGLGGVWY